MDTIDLQSKLTNRPTLQLKSNSFLLVLSALEMPAAEPEALVRSFPGNSWLLLLIVLLVGAVVYSRWQQSQKITAFRTQLSSDLHDDAGSILAGIAMQAELMALQVPEDHRESMDRLATLSRQAMESLRDVVWAMDGRKDSWSALVDRVHDYAVETLSCRQIRFQIETSGITAEKQLPNAVRKHLYLITKEAIANVARHSDADQVTIRFTESRGHLRVAILDNGRTASTAALKTSGLGISNIRMRAQELGAQLKIQQGNGFGVHLHMMAV
ncbi:MAG: hypothetical protein KDC44_09085 [Phaeodactylibacter sp.]|nr:hypothetical protein [Phaeodactylibacter sp.]